MNKILQNGGNKTTVTINYQANSLFACIIVSIQCTSTENDTSRSFRNKEETHCTNLRRYLKICLNQLRYRNITGLVFPQKFNSYIFISFSAVLPNAACNTVWSGPCSPPPPTNATEIPKISPLGNSVSSKYCNDVNFVFLVEQFDPWDGKYKALWQCTTSSSITSTCTLPGIFLEIVWRGSYPR